MGREVVMRRSNTLPATTPPRAEALECRPLMAAAPDTLELRVNPNTGAVRLIGNASDPAEVSGYEIASTAGSVGAANWNSLTDQGQPGWVEFVATNGRVAEGTVDAAVPSVGPSGLGI